jgi:hypothetical protein
MLGMLLAGLDEGGRMPELIKFFGGLIALAGACGIALAVYLKFDPYAGMALPGTVLPSPIEAAIYGMSVLISGLALYCLAAAVEHLKAIRGFQRRQVEVFERMGKNRAASPSTATTLSESSPRIVREDARRATGHAEDAARQDDKDQLELLVKRAS